MRGRSAAQYDRIGGMAECETENGGKRNGERRYHRTMGENLVRFADIATEGRMFGRGGAGAVMGSKNLKAVVLKGSQRSILLTPKD